MPSAAEVGEDSEDTADGVYLPRQFLPDVLKRVGEFSPRGTSLAGRLDGTGPQPLQLAVPAVFTPGWQRVGR